MNTVTMNLDNWTGEVVTIKYTNKLKFSMYDYTFWMVVRYSDEYGQIVGLHGNEWSDGPLKELFFGPDVTPEQMIRRAVVYVANHV